MSETMFSSFLRDLHMEEFLDSEGCEGWTDTSVAETDPLVFL